MTNDEAIDREVPHAARIYDYLLGGTNHFPIDRAAAEAAFSGAVGGLEGAKVQIRGNRQFLVRAVRALAGEAGARQFLDIGTGIPNDDNVHAVARTVTPDAKVVYVDKDPSVLAHAATLLAGDGSTTFVDADLRHPAKILREARVELDFEKPVAVMLVAVLHFLGDADEPHEVVRQLVDAVPSGSHLAISHVTEDVPGYDKDMVRQIIGAYNARTSETMVTRSAGELARFFDGLELLEPGLVPVTDWRPDRPDDQLLPFLCAVARKP